MIKLPKKIAHISFVVKDIEKVKEYWSSTFGVGPWRILELEGTPASRKNGKPMGDYKCKIAFAEIGQVSVELIEPVEGDTIWKEFLDSKGEGIHHISFGQVDNYKDEIEKWKRHGINILQEDEDIGYAYMDTVKNVGTILEFNPKRESQKP